MPGATANREQVSLQIETTPGTAMTTGDVLRFSTCNIKGNTTTVLSDEIRSDRQTADVIQTRQEAGGSISGEIAYDDGAFVKILRAAANSGAFSGTTTTTTAITATSTTLSGTGIGTGTTTVGDIVRVEGGTNDGIICMVTTVDSANLITVTPTKALAAASNGTALSVLDSVQSSTTQVALTIQRNWLDIPTNVLVGTGMEVQSMTFSMQEGAIPTWSADFLGIDADFLLAAVIGSPNAASTNPVVNPVTGVKVGLDGAAAALVQSVEVTIANANRSRHVIDGSASAESIGTGRAVISGTVTLLLGDVTTAAKVSSDTPVDMVIAFQDGTGDHGGNCYAIGIPNVKLTDADTPNQGLDTDIPLTMTFSGYLNSDLGSGITFAKIDNT